MHCAHIRFRSALWNELKIALIYPGRDSVTIVVTHGVFRRAGLRTACLRTACYAQRVGHGMVTTAVRTRGYLPSGPRGFCSIR